jgi:hypothetical protein
VNPCVSDDQSRPPYFCFRFQDVSVPKPLRVPNESTVQQRSAHPHYCDTHHYYSDDEAAASSGPPIIDAAAGGCLSLLLNGAGKVGPAYKSLMNRFCDDIGHVCSEGGHIRVCISYTQTRSNEIAAHMLTLMLAQSRAHTHTCARKLSYTMIKAYAYCGSVALGNGTARQALALINLTRVDHIISYNMICSVL